MKVEEERYGPRKRKRAASSVSFEAVMTAERAQKKPNLQENYEGPINNGTYTNISPT